VGGDHGHRLWRLRSLLSHLLTTGTLTLGVRRFLTALALSEEILEALSLGLASGLKRTPR
jgi:hypothetical protein